MATRKSKLGFNGASSMVVGEMIGGGIFSTLRVVVKIAGDWTWLSFTVAGFITFAAGYLVGTYGEGERVFAFLREVNATGFAGGPSWVLIVGYVLTNAVYAFTFGQYLRHVSNLGSGFRTLLQWPSCFHSSD